MFDFHPDQRDQTALDTPVAASFATHWAKHAQRRGAAHALLPQIGHFASLEDKSSKAHADLANLVKARGAPVLILQANPIESYAGLDVLLRANGVQMVLNRPGFNAPQFDIVDLGTEDASSMLALARLTKPGPFEPETYRLGDFIGIRHRGQLVAMAGQRMSFPGWTEISAVCVHPDHRGRGFAQSLMATMAKRLVAQDVTPFLHTYADNTTAIRLYEHLGFEVRAEVHLAQMG